ncbi:MAG: TIGR02996 domain-containing protein [Polyangiaceae bacterium]
MSGENSSKPTVSVTRTHVTIVDSNGVATSETAKTNDEAVELVEAAIARFRLAGWRDWQKSYDYETKTHTSTPRDQAEVKGLSAPSAEWIERLRKAPDDDAARLVLADELMQKSDPLGELIAVQCALHRAGPEPDANSAETRRLKLRESALLKSHAERWTAELQRYTTTFTFARGFVDEARLGANTLVKHARAVFEAAPLLRSLEMLGTPEPGELDELFRVPGMARLERLLASHTEVAEALVRAVDFKNLKSLVLQSANLGDARVAALVGAPQLAHLERLDLGDNELGGAAASAIGRAGLRLRALLLYKNSILAEGAKALAASPHLSDLEELGLGGNKIGSDAVERMAGAFRKLIWLDLRRSNLAPKGYSALAASRGFDSVRTLDLLGNKVGAPGAEALAKGGGLASLTDLDLCQTKLGDDGVAKLVEAPFLAHVTKLNLRSNALTDKSANVLAGAEVLANLTSLNLNNNDFTAKGRKTLAASKSLAKCRIYVDGGVQPLKR